MVEKHLWPADPLSYFDIPKCRWKQTFRALSILRSAQDDPQYEFDMRIRSQTRNRDWQTSAIIAIFVLLVCLFVHFLLADWMQFGFDWSCVDRQQVVSNVRHLANRFDRGREEEKEKKTCQTNKSKSKYVRRRWDSKRRRRRECTHWLSVKSVRHLVERRMNGSASTYTKSGAKAVKQTHAHSSISPWVDYDDDDENDEPSAKH